MSTRVHKTALPVLFVLLTGAAPPAAHPGDGFPPTLLQTLGTQQRSQAGHLASVGNDGQATQSVAFDLPPALLQPAVSLQYQSGAGATAETAAGWSLGFGPQIVRPTAKHYAAGEYLLSGADASGVLRVGPSGSYELHTSSPSHVVADFDTGTNAWTIYLACGDCCQPMMTGASPTPRCVGGRVGPKISTPTASTSFMTHTSWCSASPVVGTELYRYVFDYTTHHAADLLETVTLASPPTAPGPSESHVLATMSYQSISTAGGALATTPLGAVVPSGHGAGDLVQTVTTGVPLHTNPSTGRTIYAASYRGYETFIDFNGDGLLDYVTSGIPLTGSTAFQVTI